MVLNALLTSCVVLSLEMRGYTAVQKKQIAITKRTLSVLTSYGVICDNPQYQLELNCVSVGEGHFCQAWTSSP